MLDLLDPDLEGTPFVDRLGLASRRAAAIARGYLESLKALDLHDLRMSEMNGLVQMLMRNGIVC